MRWGNDAGKKPETVPPFSVFFLQAERSCWNPNPVKPLPCFGTSRASPLLLGKTLEALARATGSHCPVSPGQAVPCHFQPVGLHSVPQQAELLLPWALCSCCSICLRFPPSTPLSCLLLVDATVLSKSQPDFSPIPQNVT